MTTEDVILVQQEKVAQLRALLGKRIEYERALRGHIARARNLLLTHEHVHAKPTYPLDALSELSAALEREAP